MKDTDTIQTESCNMLLGAECDTTTAMTLWEGLRRRAWVAGHC